MDLVISPASTMMSPQSHRIKREQAMADPETSAPDYFQDDILDEFLDTRLYEDPQQLANELLASPQPQSLQQAAIQQQSLQNALHSIPQIQSTGPISPMGPSPMDSITPDFNTNSPFGTSQYACNDPLYDASIQNDEIKRYEEAKKELMKLKFGGNVEDNNDDAKIDSSNPDVPESPEVCRSPVPEEYLNFPDDYNFPYQLNIIDLPSCSRVETQIKLRLSVSPAPPQFLLHVPRDTIAKPKLTLEDSELSETVQSHMLFLDTFVVGAQAMDDPESIRSFNVCRRCLRRELKRASRRKSGIVEESSGWNINKPKRAIIFNCKEVVSFPQPSGDTSQRTLELFSRIVCYCRHHMEPNGFRLFFVLKDATGKVLGRTFSDTIMIMDRKKSTKGRQGSVDDKMSASAVSESSSDFTAATNTTANVSVRSSLAAASSVSSSVSSAVPPQAFTNPDEVPPLKRQKRPWSPSEAMSAPLVNSTKYFDTGLPQRRSRKKDSFSSVSVKREPISPLSSDTLSPQNNLYSSATSVFSTTPEKKGVSPPSQQAQALAQQQQTRVQSNSLPTIQRIIPAQGPIRGGVEVTLLGTNFRPGMGVKFGASVSLATHCWSDSTLVTYLPPAAQPGPVLVTIQDGSGEVASSNPTSHQIFTYTDDSDRQLIELALQIVGLKMNGKLEDAKNIAKRIIGNNSRDGQSDDGSTTSSHSSEMRDAVDTSAWLSEASNRMKQIAKTTTLDHEQILVKFLSMIDLPNSPVVTPNWAICTLESQTMLHLAAMRGYFKLSRYLIEHGSKVDSRDSNGLTPLHQALIHGHRDVIELLIRCKASTASKLPGGLSLQDIADPNVLDLLETIDDNVSEGILTREQSLDSLSSLMDDSSAPRVKATQIPRRFMSDSECEADSEDNTDYSASDGVELSSAEVSQEGEIKEASSSPKRKTIGLGLWMAMRDAFTTRMDSGTIVGQDLSDDATMIADETVTLVDDREEEVATVVEEDGEDEELPSYDDLFPNGGSWRSLINFRSHDEKARQQTAGATSTSESELDSPRTQEEEVEDAIISMKSQQRLNADKRLLFFWLPFMLLLLLIVVGSHLNLISLQEFSMASKAVEGARDFVGSVMLGKDRFTGLLNENLSFGRERMGKVLNDMNDAVLTAVGVN